MTEILLKVALNTITLTTIMVVIALFSTHFMFFTLNTFRTPPSDYFISSTHFIILLLFISFCLHVIQCSRSSVALLSIHLIDFQSFYCSAFMYLFFIDLIVLLYSLSPGDRRDRDRVVIGFTTTDVISAYHH